MKQISIQTIIDDLTKIANDCYNEDVDIVFIGERIEYIIDELKNCSQAITGKRFFKLQQDYETTYAIANEKGIIEIANNDRECDDGSIADEFKNIDDAIEFLENEKGINVEEINVEQIDVNKNYIVVE